MAVDSGDNVIIAGNTSNSSGDYTVTVVKYAAANGALLWSARAHEVAGSGNGSTSDLAVDRAGNVIVTGSAAGSAGNSDIYTAKYASEDGALLWEMRYNGTGNLHDIGEDITVDREGNVIVTGLTNNNSDRSSSDFYTAKYVPVDLDLDDDGLLDSWEIAHFGSTAAHSALDDTDGDGAVELLELAFGTDPLTPNAGTAPAVVVEGGYLTATIAKQPGVTYLVQTSATLESGFSATSTTVLTDTGSTLKVRDNVLISTQPARFLRVQVTAAP